MFPSNGSPGDFSGPAQQAGSLGGTRKKNPAPRTLFESAHGRVEKPIERSLPGQAAHFRWLHTCQLNASSSPLSGYRLSMTLTSLNKRRDSHTAHTPYRKDTASSAYTMTLPVDAPQVCMFTLSAGSMTDVTVMRGMPRAVFADCPL